MRSSKTRDQSQTYISRRRFDKLEMSKSKFIHTLSESKIIFSLQQKAIVLSFVTNVAFLKRHQVLP